MSPAISKKQFKFMQAAAHNPKFAKKVGIAPSVASEYVSDQTNYKELPQYSNKFKRLKKAMK